MECPKCGKPMLMMYGCGWDYDRWICPHPISDEEYARTHIARLCDGEIELTTTTFPEDIENE
jgi:hypothetical protein